MKLPILFLAILFLFSCKPKEELATNGQALKRVWMLTSFKDFEKVKLMQYQAFIDLTTVEKGAAKMGCNAIFFTYNVKEDNKINFSNVGSTEMYCNEKMEVENAFVKEIASYKTYEVKGHKLIITNDKNEQIECIAQDWD